MRNWKSVVGTVTFTGIVAVALFSDLDSVRHWGDIEGRGKGVATKYLRHDFLSNDKQRFLHQRYLSYNDVIDRPTISIIDVSYDGYSPPANSEYEPMVNQDKSTSNTFTGESEPVTPPPTLVTLPIFVIGFSGTIAMCALFMLCSDLRARRKFDKDMIMLIQSISSNNSSAFSHGRSLQSSIPSVEQQNSKQTLDSIFGSIYADAGSGSDKENYVPIIPVCICDSSTENLSSLYYDVNRPEQFYCAKAAKAAVAAWKGQNENSNNNPDRLFLDDNRDWEILFYRSEDSASVASTITKSQPPSDYGQKNEDSMCNESDDCKIIELTEIHRVSTGITIESLVELGTISAATATIAKPSSVPSTTPLHIVDQQDTTEVNIGDENNTETCDDQTVDESNRETDFQIVRKCSISDFDAGTPPIAEVMTGEDCISTADESDNIEMVNIRDEKGVETKDDTLGRNGCSLKKSKESSFVVSVLVADASSNVSSSSSSASCGDIESHVSEVNSVDSLNTVWIAELEPPPSTLTLDEGSFVEVSKRNENTRIDNDYEVINEDEKDDGKEASGNNGIFGRQDEYIDFIRSSSSSSSVEASTIINCNSQEDRTCREEHDCGFESRVEP